MASVGNSTLSREFHEQGFIRVGQLAAKTEVAEFRKIFDLLFLDEQKVNWGLDKPVTEKGASKLPQVLGPSAHFPELRSSAFVQNSRRIAAEILRVPETDLSMGDHMIYKPALTGAETPWHQDEAYWDPQFTTRACSCWLALDDVGVDAGCMQFIPGSHTEDVRAHKHINDDPLVHGLVTREPVDSKGAVPCPLDAGGATFHHRRTLHYTAPNTTPNPRRAYILIWTSKGHRVRSEQPEHRPWQHDEAEAFAKVGVSPIGFQERRKDEEAPPMSSSSSTKVRSSLSKL